MFMNAFTFSYTVTSAIGLCLCVRYQSKFSIRRRCDVPLLINGIVFAGITLMVEMEDISNDVFFWTTLSFVCISGVTSAVFQSGIFGLAGLLPPQYTQALMGGQGLAGMTIAAAAVISTYAVAGDSSQCGAPYSTVKDSTVAYFGFSSAVLFLCIFGYYYMENLEFFKHHTRLLNKDERALKPQEEGDEAASLNQGLLANEAVIASDAKLPEEGEEDEPPQDNVVTIERLRKVFASIKTYALSVFFIFFITLLVFPSTTVMIQSTTDSTNPIFNELWIPLSFLNFNVFDFAGRMLAGVKPYPFNPENIWFPTVLRTIFPVMFLFCNTSDSDGVVPNLLTNDLWPVGIMALFALSNGYLSSNLMMLGPTSVDPNHAEIAGTLMVFFLTFGLLSGSLCSFLLLPLTI